MDCQNGTEWDRAKVAPGKMGQKSIAQIKPYQLNNQSQVTIKLTGKSGLKLNYVINYKSSFNLALGPALGRCQLIASGLTIRT